MTPEAVAAVFKELKDDEVVKILSFMKETESAQIMELLAKQGGAQAKRAATISERMRVVVARAGNEKPKL